MQAAFEKTQIHPGHSCTAGITLSTLCITASHHKKYLEEINADHAGSIVFVCVVHNVWVLVASQCSPVQSSGCHMDSLQNHNRCPRHMLPVRASSGLCQAVPGVWGKVRSWAC